MRLTCEYELDILSNTKVILTKINGENYMNFQTASGLPSFV